MSTTASIPEKSWENPFQPGTFLHKIFGEVVRENRDIAIILDDFRARRGTGKTVTSLKLAQAMDQTPEGITKDKVSLHPEELREAYSQQPKRSGLVLDEGELGASNRQAMTSVNQALREIMSIGRVQEKYLVINAPAKKFIDKDILNLCDVWITMTRRGHGLVHHLKWEPYTERLYTPKKQHLELSDIPSGTELRDVYNHLTREKQKAIGGENDSGYVPRKEVKQQVERREREVKRETRDEVIHDLYKHEAVDVSQQKIADAVGVAQKTVSNAIERVEERE